MCAGYTSDFMNCRQRLCTLKNWESFGEKEDIISNTATVQILQPRNGTLKKQLSFDFDPEKQTILQPPLCRWKDVYIRAFHLEMNWAQGRYTVAPLLRGHKEPITSISLCGKKLLCLYFNILRSIINRVCFCLAVL